MGVMVLAPSHQLKQMKRSSYLRHLPVPGLTNKPYKHWKEETSLIYYTPQADWPAANRPPDQWFATLYQESLQTRQTPSYISRRVLRKTPEEREKRKSSSSMREKTKTLSLRSRWAKEGIFSRTRTHMFPNPLSRYTVQLSN